MINNLYMDLDLVFFLSLFICILLDFYAAF